MNKNDIMSYEDYVKILIKLPIPQFEWGNKNAPHRQWFEDCLRQFGKPDLDSPSFKSVSSSITGPSKDKPIKFIRKEFIDANKGQDIDIVVFEIHNLYPTIISKDRNLLFNIDGFMDFFKASLHYGYILKEQSPHLHQVVKRMINMVYGFANSKKTIFKSNKSLKFVTDFIHDEILWPIRPIVIKFDTDRIIAEEDDGIEGAISHLLEKHKFIYDKSFHTININSAGGISEKLFPKY